jgi:probable O-glycosylation ligase (exosortase A-associated)
MRDLLITLVVCGVLPMVLVRPHIGILLWSWLSYMNPHRLTWGFAYNFPFAAVTAATLLIAVFFSREPKRLPLTAVTVVWILFVAWMGISTLLALNPEDAMAEFERASKIQLMTLLTLMLMQARERIHQLTWIIVLSLGFFGTKGGLFTLATGGQFMVWGPPDTFIDGNNEIALALIMALPLMRYLQLQTHNKWVRRLIVIMMACTALAILSTYSRGAFLAGATMCGMLILKSRRRVLFGMTMAAVIVAGLSFMPEQWSERMGTIRTYDEDESAMGRINAWWFAFNLAKDHPLVGGGFNAFQPDLFRIYAPDPDDFHDAHSIYFEVLAEHGFVGLALFVSLGWLAMRTGNWIVRHTRTDPELSWARDLAAMLQVSLVGFAVGGAFLGLAYFDLPYHLIAMLVLVRRIVEQRLQDKSAAVAEHDDATQIPGFSPAEARSS